MKVILDKGGLLVMPETEFEESTLEELFPLGLTFPAYLKTGVTVAETVGIRIKNEPIKQENKSN